MATLVVVASAALAGTLWWQSVRITARGAVQRGDRYVAQKKYHAAILEYRAAVNRDARLGDVHFKLANAYVQIDDARDAFHEYLIAADLLPNNLDAQLKAGAALLLIGRAKEAEARADKALHIDPTSVDGRILRANATAGLRNLDDAVAQMYEATERLPDRPLDQARAYLHLGVMELARGHRQDAEGILRKATEIEPASVTNHVTLANYYWAIGRYPDAEAELNRVIALAPAEPRANRALAALYMITDRMPKAEQPLKILADSSSDPAARFLLTDYYLVTRRVGEAKALLEKLAADVACFAQARLREALIEYEAGRIAKAEQIIDGALLKEPKHPRLILMKARLLAEAHEYTDALKRAYAAVAAEPKLAEGHFLVATIHVARNEPVEAINAFNQVLKLRPTLVDALLQLSALHLARGDADTSVRFAEQALAIAPQNAAAHLAAFDGYLARGNVVRAEAELTPLVSANPRSAVILRQWGRLLAQKQDIVAARQFFVRALEVDPGLIDALSDLVGLEIAAGHAADVRITLEARLTREPNTPRLLFLAARLYAAMGDEAKEVRALRQVVEIDPANLRAYGALGQVYYSKGRLDEARREFEAMAARQPTSVGAHTLLAMIQELEQKPGDAKRTYEHVLDLDPQAAVAANNLACMYVRTGGNLDVAVQLAQTAASRFPNEPEFSDTLGWIYVKKNLPASAIPPLQDSVRLNPRNASFRYHLAVAYLRKGDQRLARVHLDRALGLQQDFEGVEDARAMVGLLPPITSDADSNPLPPA